MRSLGWTEWETGAAVQTQHRHDETSQRRRFRSDCRMPVPVQKQAMELQHHQQQLWDAADDEEDIATEEGCLRKARKFR